MLLLEDKRFYVYIYLDPRKPGKYIYGEYNFNYEPIYVGKGCNQRDILHLSIYKKVKSKFYNTLNKIINNGFTPIFFRIKDNLIEEESFKLEIKLISIIGRQINKNGPLLNYRTGGDGGSHSEETKKKISESHIGIKNTEETKIKISKKNKGRKMSEETKRKISISNTGRKHTEEYKQKMSKLFTGRKLSEETKKKIGEKSKLKTEESWKNTREARKKSKLSEEGRKKISERTIAMNKSDDFRKKLSKASERRERDEKGHFISYKNKENNK